MEPESCCPCEPEEPRLGLVAQLGEADEAGVELNAKWDRGSCVSK